MRSSSFPTRRRSTAAEQLRWVARYEASGLTQEQFARRHGLRVNTLRQWLYRGGGRARAIRASGFKELPLSAVLSSGSWDAEIILGEQPTVRLGRNAPAAWVTELLKAVVQAC